VNHWTREQRCRKFSALTYVGYLESRRLIATPEAYAHAVYKQKIPDANDD